MQREWYRGRKNEGQDGGTCKLWKERMAMRARLRSLERILYEEKSFHHSRRRKNSSHLNHKLRIYA